MANSQTKTQIRVEKKTEPSPSATPMMPEITPPPLTSLRDNDRIVFDALLQVNDVTRSELVKLCSLPRTTIYDALVRLERLGVVERFFEKRSTRGRPKTFYRCTQVYPTQQNGERLRKNIFLENPVGDYSSSPFPRNYLSPFSHKVSFLHTYFIIMFLSLYVQLVSCNIWQLFVVWYKDCSLTGMIFVDFVCFTEKAQMIS